MKMCASFRHVLRNLEKYLFILGNFKFKIDLYKSHQNLAYSYSTNGIPLLSCLTLFTNAFCIVYSLLFCGSILQYFNSAVLSTGQGLNSLITESLISRHINYHPHYHHHYYYYYYYYLLINYSLDI